MLEPPALRASLVPAALVVVFVAFYAVRVPFGWAVAASAPLVLLFLVAPAWAARSVQAFDRDAVLALSRGQRDQLPALYRRALGMRLFAPVGVRAERRGLVASESGDREGALVAYREAAEAWRRAGGTAPVSVWFGLAGAAEALGRWPDAAEALRVLAKHDAAVPGLSDRLARAESRLGASG